MNAIKKPALALASAALALGAVFASAGPAHADDDHVDLVFVPTCNLSHNFTSGDFFLNRTRMANSIPTTSSSSAAKTSSISVSRSSSVRTATR